MNLGEVILELMKKNNMTQKELAIKLNVTEASMSRYLNNERIPRIDVLTSISRVFNVSIDTLTGLEEKETDFLNVKRLVARNASKMTPEEKLEIAKMLLKD